MIDTRAANLGVFGDPAVMLVTAAQPANVDTVVVDGRILKRDGKLTTLNVRRSQGRRGGEPCRAQARQLVVIKSPDGAYRGRCGLLKSRRLNNQKARNASRKVHRQSARTGARVLLF